MENSEDESDILENRSDDDTKKNEEANKTPNSKRQKKGDAYRFLDIAAREDSESPDDSQDEISKVDDTDKNEMATKFDAQLREGYKKKSEMLNKVIERVEQRALGEERLNEISSVSHVNKNIIIPGTLSNELIIDRRDSFPRGDEDRGRSSTEQKTLRSFNGQRNSDFTNSYQRSSSVIGDNSGMSIGTLHNPIFAARCIDAGREMEVVIRCCVKSSIMEKDGKKTGIYSVFALPHIRGYIYFEAISLPVVREFVTGFTAINSNRIQGVPLTEVPRILRGALEKATKDFSPLFPGSFIRMKGSHPYKGDIAQVMNSIEDKVLVRLVPRISFTEGANRINPLSKSRPVQSLFSQETARDSGLEVERILVPDNLGESNAYDYCNGHRFKEGYLYKEVSRRNVMFHDEGSTYIRGNASKSKSNSNSSLSIEDIENFIFFGDKSKAKTKEGEKMLRDILKSCDLSFPRNSELLTEFHIREKVKVIRGELFGIYGFILSVEPDLGLVTLNTVDDINDINVNICADNSIENIKNDNSGNKITIPLNSVIKVWDISDAVYIPINEETGTVTKTKDYRYSQSVTVLLDFQKTEVIVDSTHLIPSHMRTLVHSIDGNSLRDLISCGDGRVGVIVGFNSKNAFTILETNDTTSIIIVPHLLAKGGSIKKLADNPQWNRNSGKYDGARNTQYNNIRGSGFLTDSGNRPVMVGSLVSILKNNNETKNTNYDSVFDSHDVIISNERPNTFNGCNGRVLHLHEDSETLFVQLYGSHNSVLRHSTLNIISVKRSYVSIVKGLSISNGNSSSNYPHIPIRQNISSSTTRTFDGNEVRGHHSKMDEVNRKRLGDDRSISRSDFSQSRQSSGRDPLKQQKNLMHRRVRITVGFYKGYIALVKDVTDSNIRGLLEAKGKIVVIPKENILLKNC